ncbi:MAG: hypothetical protein CMN31_27535 [Sandaracinus sp.]|nr:hypothetical protein [Sandaracinus sp.]
MGASMRSSSIAPPGRQPRQIGHYKVLHLLARGGMGDVYLARDTRLGRVVAVKRASLDLAERPEVRKQFLLEAQATAQLAHPNVVTIYDVGDDGGVPWAAYEYVEGRTLARRLRDGVPSRPEAMRIALDVAAALVAAHDKELIHRDLKPANIMIGRDGRTRVLDFGIARFFRRAEDADAPGGEAEASAEAFLGTPGYMSPEQWRHEDHIATDVWAFGLILCELFTGEPPLSGRSHVEILRMITTGEPIALPSAVQRLPRPLQEQIRACLQLEPEARPAMSSVLEALEELAERPQRDAPAPLPGDALAPLGAEDTDRLLGRERELAALDEALALRALCFVVGEPGAGKTSLVEAGLLPARRARGQRVVRCALGDRPLRDLASALVAEARGAADATRVERQEVTEVDPGGELPAERTVVDAIHGEPTRARHGGLLLDADDLGAHLRREPGVLALALETLASTWPEEGPRRGETETPRREVLLWIDGLERVVGDEDARTLLEALELATLGRDEGWRVVASVRADAFGALPLSPQGRRRAGLVQVEVPGPETLRAILRRSVASWGYEVDDAEALDALVAPLAQDPFGLLMLQALLAELWLRRDPSRRVVGTGEAAREGLARTAFARHADGVFDALSPTQREKARSWLVELGLPMSRQVLQLDAPDAEERAAVEALVKGRVLRPAGTEGALTLAHPALPRLWPRLARWIAEADADADLALELEDAARRWSERDRSEEALLTGGALERAVGLAERRALSPETLQFVLESEEQARRAARRRRWRRRGVVLGAVVAAAISGAVSLRYSERAEEARAAQQTAEESRAALLAQSAILELEAGRIRSARARARAALERHDTLSGRLAFERTRREPVRWRTRWAAIGYEVALDPERERAFVALQSGELAELDLLTAAERRVRVQDDQATCLSLEGDRLVVGGYDGTLSVLDPDALDEAASFRRTLPGPILRVVALADGRVAVALRNRGVLLVDPRGERADRALVPDLASVFGLAATANGRWLGVAGETGELHVVDLRTDRVASVVPLGDHGSAQAMATDGARFVLGTSSGTVLAVDWARRAVEAHELLDGRVRALTVDGERVLAADLNGGLAWLDLGTGASRRVADVPGGVVGLDAAGSRALLTGRDGAVLFDWTRRAPAASQPLEPIYGLAFDPAGRRVVASQGGSLVMRAREDGRLLRRARPSSTWPRSYARSPGRPPEIGSRSGSRPGAWSWPTPPTAPGAASSRPRPWARASPCSGRRMRSSSTRHRTGAWRCSAPRRCGRAARPAPPSRGSRRASRAWTAGPSSGDATVGCSRSARWRVTTKGEPSRSSSATASSTPCRPSPRTRWAA